MVAHVACVQQQCPACDPPPYALLAAAAPIDAIGLVRLHCAWKKVAPKRKRDVENLLAEAAYLDAAAIGEVKPAKKKRGWVWRSAEDLALADVAERLKAP